MDKALFVSRLKDAKEKKGITIKELADQCGVSTSAMNRYLAETSMPTLDVAINMAKALNVSLDWLCGLKSEANARYTTGLVMRMLSDLLVKPTIVEDGHKFYAANFDADPGNPGELYIYIDPLNTPGSIDFQSWSKFIDLYRNGTIDKTMYNAWMEKMATERETSLLPRTVIKADDLPF